ncbi:uncharacterized protein LOC129797490 isoform X2 [Lutzomyia longipalpis]|uniref:uncharacterized protein LOC129797490 isoform X2 n=1 Tax=Lutzomyia longipalpis TaxID=7200 RepID=UPI0024846B9A|nr:uncharacterized protein LOC129797490 isoform X2 [Lutzomyia longipalpis]XP_055696110.1 uncharacterized protein LOC129797490 isoform X2 [Lutzomyia longipalpis]
MALNPAFLKATALQQLLDEINFQRTKEMRQLLKDDSGFVVLQGTTYWTDLFVRHFLFQAEPEHSIDSDDLLFFVRKKHVKGSSRHMPKFETDVDVFRKDSRKLPIGDPDVDWEETVYLNLVIHQFDYKLTLAICTRTSPKELQVLRRHTQRVYASPSRRKMDTKGEGEEMTYPHICFMVDNFDEVFSDILVRDGEMVCVELVASDRDGSVQGVIFLGSIRYDALKKVYDARQSSLSSKVAQRMMFGLFSSGGPQTRCEFVRMKGPQGKGHAEMAVTKPKGSGVETPTSEPGFCATDMWDTDWDDENEDFYTYRHQRRLSDPSANLNHFARFAWKTKSGQDGTAGSKARSENEGLDSLANDISEIEAGDLRDDRPASSASDTKLASATSCCTCCFGSKKRWSDSASAQMSDVYCRTCDEANSPACLANVTPKRSRPKHQNLLTVESEIEMPGSQEHKKLSIKEKKKSPKTFDSSRKEIKKVTESPKGHRKNNRNNVEEYELADDATSLNGDLTDDVVKIGVLSDLDPRLIVRVHGKEELPVVQQRQSGAKLSQKLQKKLIDPAKDPHPLSTEVEYHENEVEKKNNVKSDTNLNSKRYRKEEKNQDVGDVLNGNFKKISCKRFYSTFPKRKRSTIHHSMWYSRPISLKKVPQKTTPDGTNIYYWCDMPKKSSKELDDGAYNPLWASKGFTQTFHFWKENRRQQSTPLNAFLTYVTLPWWSIAKDLLDHREAPILTF